MPQQPKTQYPAGASRTSGHSPNLKGELARQPRGIVVKPISQSGAAAPTASPEELSYWPWVPDELELDARPGPLPSALPIERDATVGEILPAGAPADAPESGAHRD